MHNNEPWIVQRMLGNKTGRGAMVYRLRIKNIVTNQTMDVGFDSAEKFNEVQLDFHKVKLSYMDGDNYVFMEEETFEQFELTAEDVGDNSNYLAPGDDFVLEITFYEGKPVGLSLPILVDREITYCEPGLKGDTSGKASKAATLDTGYVVQVPLFCDIGTKVRIDTRDGSFSERVK
jgi:elongation factor P